MKKLIGVFVLMLFSLTACGEMTMESMNCSYENSSDTLTSRTSYNIDYIDNTVKKVRITYDYQQLNTITDDDTNQNDTTVDNDIDGVDTGTDGVTSDNGDTDNNEVVDGVVGNAIDSVVNAVSDTILDVVQYRNRHNSVQNMYSGINGFSVQNTSDSDDNRYTVTYVIDFDQISDDDLNTLNLSRDVDTLRSQFANQGFTCSE